MTISVYESSRFEPLWRRFEEALRIPPASPLAPETVVVPASGWESYCNRRLASARGCWARYEFLTIGQWVSRTLREVLGPESTYSRDADALMWAVAAKLPALLDNAPFHAVRSYLAPDGSLDEQRLMELAHSIGGLFDQYLLYRPELIEVWEKGRDWPQGAPRPVPTHAPWQRRLWNAIRKDPPIKPVAALVAELSKALQRGRNALPGRVSVWLCGGLPPVYLDFLEAVGRNEEIAVYALSPSREILGDQETQLHLLEERCAAGTSMRAFFEARSEQPPHPLRLSLGTLSLERQFLMRNRRQDPWRVHKPDPGDAAPCEPPSLLGELQDRIRTAGAAAAPGIRADQSLRIHNCHSAIREVEVLREQLREAFEEDKELQPEDVVVLCPDVETYAPLFQAVFGRSAPGTSGPPGQIPYNVAGRSPRQTRPIVDAYFRLLALLQGRFPVREVLDLLRAEPIAAKSGLESGAIEQLSQWIASSGIRWGADREHRVEEGLPDTDLNTWAFGFDRLLMGYAMPPGGGQNVEGVVALDRAEGLDAGKLGTFWMFLAKLRQKRALAGERHTMEGWREPLCRLAETFLATELDESGVQWILNAIDRLVTLAGEGGYTGELSFRMAVQALARQVDQGAAGRPFRLGGVTVCELSAMRGLPFKVVALVGLHDETFPRGGQRTGFDLIGRHPRPGDRRPRLEDKERFLEAILSARSRLIITYQGQNLRDPGLRPPSVAVEELLDSIEQDFGGEAPGAMRSELSVPHPLQAFSTRYFDGRDERLFSYEQRHLRTARKLAGEQENPPLFAHGLLASEGDLEPIRVPDFQKLFKAPWELFLRRLGVRLANTPETFEDREPLYLDNLERWKIGDLWIKGLLEGSDREALQRRFERSGQLPAGALGQAVLAELRRQAWPVVKAAQASGLAQPGSGRRIRLEVDGALLSGSVADVSAEGIRRTTYSKISPKQALPLWLDHLLVTVSERRTLPAAVLVGRPGKQLRIEGIESKKAMDELVQLVRLYRLARCAPFPFFEEAVGKVLGLLCEKKLDLSDAGSRANALKKAREAYVNERAGLPDARKPSVRTAFRGRDPFLIPSQELPGLKAGDEEASLFFYLVRKTCVPLISHLKLE